MANVTTIYACTAEGLFIFNKPGTSPEWLPPHHVLEGRRVLSAWAEPGPPTRLLAVASAAGASEDESGDLLSSMNGGRAWEISLDAPVTTVTRLVDDPLRLYAGMSGGGLAGSADGGTDWGVLPALPKAGIIWMLLADQQEPGRLFALMEHDGETFALAGNPDEGEWNILAVSEVSAMAQEAGTGDLYAATVEGVQMSADKGAIFDPLPGSPTDGETIVVIPGPSNSPVTLVVGTPSGLFISPDGGGNWQAAELPHPGGVTALARDPERRDRLYAATSTGYLMESGNRGQEWQPINTEPVAPVDSLFVIRI